MAARPPLKVLGPNDLPGPHNDHSAPRRIYGWPFSEEYTLEYARRHGLVFSVPQGCRSEFDGKAEFNFADLTDDHLADEESLPHLRRIATLRVLNHLRENTGAALSVERPISLERQWLFVLWSTEDVEEMYWMYRRIGNWRKLEAFIDAAMNECLPEGCERRSSLEWWWSREKNEVRGLLVRLLRTIADPRPNSFANRLRLN